MLAWVLSLAGWIGVPALALGLRPGDLQTAGLLLGLWMCAQFVMPHAMNGASPVLLRIARVMAAALGSIGLIALSRGAGQGGGLDALWAAVLGWGALLGLAPTVHRVGTEPRESRAAAVGALFAWLVLADYTDAGALAQRLAIALPLIGVALVWRDAPVAADKRLAVCLLPLPADAPWSLRLAAWSMLPMMCALPWMASLCGDTGRSPSADLALHYLLMFAPAGFLGRGWTSARIASMACVALLGAGAALYVAVPAVAGAATLLTLTQGAAWAMAQSARRA